MFGFSFLYLVFLWKFHFEARLALGKSAESAISWNRPLPPPSHSFLRSKPSVRATQPGRASRTRGLLAATHSGPCGLLCHTEAFSPWNCATQSEALLLLPSSNCVPHHHNTHPVLWTHLRGEGMAAGDFLAGTFHRSDPLTILSLLKADRGGTINAGATDPRVLTSTWLVVVCGWR